MQKKILIVEDETIVAFDLEQRLKKIGYEITDIVTSCATCLESLKVDRPDLILMDINIKGDIDGIETAAKIKEEFHIPIIFLTAFSDEETLNRAKETAPYGYILKPFDDKLLSITIDMALYKLDAERKLNYLAYNDQVTHIPNRTYFNQEVDKIVVEAAKTHEKFCLIFIDIDGFKTINDSLGHDVGDKLLQTTGEKLTESLIDKKGFVARAGGDEFVVVLRDVENFEECEKYAERIIARLSKTMTIMNYPVNISVSCGMSFYPFHSTNINQLIRYADLAVYNAKHDGGGTYNIYTSSMTEENSEKLMIENNLRKALDNKEFRIVYQPKLNVGDKKVNGMESLLRWDSEELGSVDPINFIKIAENAGLLIDIGTWILEKVFDDTKYLQEGDFPHTRVSVNISATQINNRFVPMLKRLLKEHDYDPKFLEIEITESVLLNRYISTSAIFKEIKEMGIKIAIDDFGTGYSSFEYLRSIPANTLKIDFSLIKNITKDSTDAGIVKAIVDLSHALNMSVCAEGVETFEQIKLLEDMGCDLMQGFLISYPLPGDALKFVFKQNEQKAKAKEEVGS